MFNDLDPIGLPVYHDRPT